MHEHISILWPSGPSDDQAAHRPVIKGRPATRRWMFVSVAVRSASPSARLHPFSLPAPRSGCCAGSAAQGQGVLWPAQRALEIRAALTGCGCCCCSARQRGTAPWSPLRSTLGQVPGREKLAGGCSAGAQQTGRCWLSCPGKQRAPRCAREAVAHKAIGLHVIAGSHRRLSTKSPIEPASSARPRMRSSKPS